MDMSMKLPAIGVTLVLSGLTACTTVDLSQVAVQSQPTQTTPAQQNVVERASLSLTSKFREEGWCSGGPQEKTQTATSVLLNGIQSSSLQTETKPRVEASDIRTDLRTASQHVEQATKAAEIFLETSDQIVELDKELSLLETALLSAREAEVRFGETVKVNGLETALGDLSNLQNAITALKDVTDKYGDRARSNIANKATLNRG